MMWQTHATATSPADAITQFLVAGGNVQFYDFSHEDFQAAILGSLANGTLPQAVLDARVTDVLRVKMELGLFDQPFINTSLITSNVDTPAARALALQAAREAVVLLQNAPLMTVAPDGSVSAAAPLLPLNLTTAHRNIAVVGPSADVLRLGDYAGGGLSPNFVTVLDGMRDAVAAARAGGTVTYAPGCQISAQSIVGPTLWPIRPHYLTFQSSNGVVHQGAAATYYSSQAFAGMPAFSRNDTDINFQVGDDRRGHSG
jgi:beta-glucosidase